MRDGMFPYCTKKIAKHTKGKLSRIKQQHTGTSTMVTMVVIPQDKGGGGPTITRSKHAPPSKPIAEDPNETGSLTPPRSKVGKNVLKMMDSDGPTAAKTTATASTNSTTTNNKLKKKTKKFSPKRLWNLRSGKTEQQQQKINKEVEEEVATDSQEDIEDVDNYDKEEIVDFDSPGKSGLGSSTLHDLEERYDVDHLSGDEVSGLRSLDDDDEEEDGPGNIRSPPKEAFRRSRDRNSWEAAGLKSTPPDYVSITTGRSMIDATHDGIEVEPKVLFRSVPEQEKSIAATKGNTRVSSSRPRRFGFLGWFSILILVDIFLVGVYYGQGFDFKFLKDSKSWEEEVLPLARNFAGIDASTT